MCVQFAVSIPEDEERDSPEIELFQLDCTLWLPAGPFASIENGHQWFHRPAEADFATRVDEHPVIVVTQDHRQVVHQIELEQV